MAEGARVGSASARRLFVLAGIDGAGKSTALRRVQELRPHWSVGGYDPEEWLPLGEERPSDSPVGDLDGIWPLTDRHPREIVADLDPEDRARFIARMVSAHWHHWVEPRLSNGGLVLLDSFHYRFRVKLALQGAPTGPLDRLASDLPRPRTVILLTIDAAEAARRKPAFDRQESFGEPTVERFIDFQTRLADRLERLCRSRTGEPECGELVEIDGSRSPEAVVEDLVDCIERRVGEVRS